MDNIVKFKPRNNDDYFTKEQLKKFIDEIPDDKFYDIIFLAGGIKTVWLKADYKNYFRALGMLEHAKRIILDNG